MVDKRERPGARAGAHRAEVTMLVGKGDFRTDTPVHLELQVRRLIEKYALSVPLATAVAELAFSRGGEA